MSAVMKKIRHWLLPAVLVLFILEIITFPAVVYFTYSDRSENPDHTLTYTENKLVWDSVTGIDEHGIAELSLFNAEYNNVRSKDKVVAPGTEGFNIIRLNNSASGKIGYTAVVYKISSDAELPVKAALSGNGFEDTAEYTLPHGVEKSNVIRAVSGTLGAGQKQDFDIKWLWDFYESDAQDLIDTYFGDKAANDKADDVTIGFYLVVRDGGQNVLPVPPKTGDNSMMGGYIALMCISGIILFLLIVSRRREKKDECGNS